MPYRVTTTKFLEKLECTQQEMNTKLGNISIELQRLRDEYTIMGNKIGELSERVKTQNGRIGKLERREYFAMGALAILSGVAAYVFFHVFKVVP